MKPSETNELWKGSSERQFQIPSRREQLRILFDSYVITPAKIISTDWRAQVGITVIVLFVITGTFGPVLIREPSPTGPRLVGAFQTLTYPLGTDGLGQGILAMIVWSTPTMLKMILGGGVTATIVAMTIGLYSGYKGGTVDRLITNGIDLVIVIPGFPLVIIVAAIYQPHNPYLIGIVLSVNAWAGLARMVRAETLSLRRSNYVEASRIMDVSSPVIILKDIAPNLMPYVLMQFVSMARRIIFSSVGLYFLGVLPYSNRNWGVIMNNAYRLGGLSTWSTFHWLFSPMVVIIIVTTGLTLFSQSLDQIFNPRIRVRIDSNDESDKRNRSQNSVNVSSTTKTHIEEIS